MSEQLTLEQVRDWHYSKAQEYKNAGINNVSIENHVRMGKAIDAHLTTQKELARKDLILLGESFTIDGIRVDPARVRVDAPAATCKENLQVELQPTNNSEIPKSWDREAIYTAMERVLRKHRLHYAHDEDGEALPLVDALSLGSPDISTGLEEIVLICDAVYNDLADHASKEMVNG